MALYITANSRTVRLWYRWCVLIHRNL